MDVMVLDGNQRPALAAVRSLGRKGLRVCVGEINDPSLASRSNFCGESFSYGSTAFESETFMKNILGKLSESKNSVLMPMTDVSLAELLLNKEQLDGIAALPFPGFDVYDAASDKINLMNMARRLSVPVPHTLFSEEYGGTDSLIEEAVRIGFPLVVKPGRSRYRTGRGWAFASVTHTTDEKDLRETVKDEILRNHPFMIQKRVEGPGIGIFLLIENGEVLARFAHKRLREKPPSGGVSTLCESIEPPATAYRYAVKILTHLGWSGVAMVEFKWDKVAQKPMLMEVNGRFWGSLQLAIESGVDFPYLLYRKARGEAVRGKGGYRLGIRSRWELGDLDHLLIRLKRSNPDNRYLPDHAPSRKKVAGNFLLDFIRPSVKHEVFKLKDPKPFYFELSHYMKELRGRKT